MSLTDSNNEMRPAEKALKKLFLANAMMIFVLIGLMYFAKNISTVNTTSTEEIPFVLYGVLLVFGWFELVLAAWVYATNLNRQAGEYDNASIEEWKNDNRSVHEYLCMYFWRINGVGALIWALAFALELISSLSTPTQTPLMWGTALAISLPIALISRYLEPLYRLQREQGEPGTISHDGRVNLFIIISLGGLAAAFLFLLNNLPADPTLRPILAIILIAVFVSIVALIYVIQKHWRTQKPHARDTLEVTADASAPDQYTIGDDGEIIELKTQHKR